MTDSKQPTRAAKALRIALWIDLVLIALFGLSSGIYKVTGGEADVRLYAALGLGPLATALAGAIQAAAAGALFFRPTRSVAAVMLAAVNALATAVLFANAVQPFGVISIVFVAMALAPLGLAAPPRVALPASALRSTLR